MRNENIKHFLFWEEGSNCPISHVQNGREAECAAWFWDSELEIVKIWESRKRSVLACVTKFSRVVAIIRIVKTPAWDRSTYFSIAEFSMSTGELHWVRQFCSKK